MQIEIVVPQMGESITEATVSGWLVAAGDSVSEGDVVVELETDKVMVEVPAEQGGVVLEILKGEGDTVNVGDILGKIDTEGASAGAAPADSPAAAPGNGGTAPRAAEQAAAPEPAAQPAAGGKSRSVGPAARRLAEEGGVDLAAITGSGPRGQVTKGDVAAAAAAAGTGVESPARNKGAPAMQPPREPITRSVPPAPPAPPSSPASPAPPREGGAREERVKMSRLRQRIAERLVEVQRNAAILTTFNEVDMSEVMAVRSRYKDRFKDKYGINIGFMSFFTKACIEALKAYPAVNAELEGDEVVYKNYYDIGVAVGTERGLVVPVVRDADLRSFIEVELEIAALAGKARENKLSMDDLTGGTFTISNGGIYGSMLSTPILNPPQVGILGMHNIVQRAMVAGGEVVVRPMMYLALSYDHRIIDGREAVQFLVRVKECIEDPARILLEI